MTDKMDRGLDEIIAETVSPFHFDASISLADTTQRPSGPRNRRGRGGGGPGPRRDRTEGPRDGIRKVNDAPKEHRQASHLPNFA